MFNRFFIVVCGGVSPCDDVAVEIPITILGIFPCPIAGGTNLPFCGLYTECTTTLFISIEISSTCWWYKPPVLWFVHGMYN